MPSPNASPRRPALIPSDFSAIPDTLKRPHRWLLWRFEPASDGHWQKAPFRTCGRRATPTDARTWTSFESVRSTYELGLRGRAPYDGIGFALGDGFTGIELSEIFPELNSALPLSSSFEPSISPSLSPSVLRGTPRTWAAQLVADFATYTELSPDGRGLNLFLHGTFHGPAVAPTPHAEGGTIAAYHQARFLCVTGRRWPQKSRHNIAHSETQLQALIRHLRSGYVAAAVPGVPSPAAPPLPPPCPQEHESNNASRHIETPAVLPALSAAEGSEVEGNKKHQTLPAPSNPLPAELAALLQFADEETLELLANARPISGPVRRPPSAAGLSHSSGFLSEPTSDRSQAPSAGTDDPRVADQIIELALAEFRLGRTPADESFAVPLVGANIAHMLRGGSAPLRKTLARRFHRRYGRAPSSSSLTDALNVIDAEAGELEPEEVSLRVASVRESGDPQHQTQNTKHETLSPLLSNGIVIDLGRTDGRTVLVTPEGWQVVNRSPVLFRRTPLTAQFPLPVSGGRLNRLRSLINVSDDGWQLLRGWLVAALFPSIAHPILLLGGQQGTGKSTALRMLVGLVDPSAAPLRSEPNDSEHWVMMAHGSWCVALDNISSISPWFSDALCKAVTGDGFVRRRLYTDGDFAVLEFRRVIAMTSVHPGILAGDLADRLMFVELDPIDDAFRLPEISLLSKFEDLRPQLFGALLDEVSAVLRRLPKVNLDRLPRMADFARILAALPRTPRPSPLSSDELSDAPNPGSDDPDAQNAIQDASDASDDVALAIYLSQNQKLASEVIEGDAVAVAVAELMRNRESWIGTATELLSIVTRPESLRTWPKSPQSLTGRLKRLGPAMRTMGIAIDYERDTDHMRTRRIHLRAMTVESSPK